MSCVRPDGDIADFPGRREEGLARWAGRRGWVEDNRPAGPGWGNDRPVGPGRFRGRGDRRPVGLTKRCRQVVNRPLARTDGHTAGPHGWGPVSFEMACAKRSTVGPNRPAVPPARVVSPGAVSGLRAGPIPETQLKDQPSMKTDLACTPNTGWPRVSSAK